MPASAPSCRRCSVRQRPYPTFFGLQSSFPWRQASTAGGRAAARSPQFRTSPTRSTTTSASSTSESVPARETSRQTIRSRVIGNHLNGNVSSSTFRFVLAALLIDALELSPYLRGTKVALSAHDNARLSTWQREHLLLTSCTKERPWEIESEVIAELGPPLNSAANAVHAFYPAVRAARAEFRRRARAASS
jgi:GIY-YIG catalytic domain